MNAPHPYDADDAPYRPRGLLGAINRIPVGFVLRGVLLVQFGLAFALIAPDIDVERLMDRIQGREDVIRTATFEPVTPGHQTRPYSPRTLPRRADGTQFTTGVRMPQEVGALAFSRIEHPDLGQALLLAGSIGAGDSDRLQAELDGLPDHVRHVVLHSPGGLLQEAMRMGEILRAAGLNTAVIADGACLSACPMLLFAGVERLVSPHAWVGMHQAYYPQSSMLAMPVAITSIQSLQSEVLRYTDAMGVDPLVHVHALATPPDEAYFLIDEELLRYRVATAIIGFDPEALDEASSAAGP